mgnify:CR=1 FL=1
MNRINNSVLLMAIAFVAGFSSVLIFHQPMLIILKAISLAPEKLNPYAMGLTNPLGVPRLFSLAFWGGIWGLVLALSVTWTRNWGYWLSGLIIGSLGPSLVNWFIVLPLKGEPIAGSWAPPGVATALIINGAWGLGTVILCRFLGKNFRISSKKSVAARAEREKNNR